MVHGVVDDALQTTWHPLRKQLSVKDLDRSLTTLAKHYRFISMDKAVAMLAGKEPLQPYSLVLTFDDGYRNNITHALPILQRHNAPAIFFLSTGHVERREPFWYDRLDYAIQHLRQEQHIYFSGKIFLFRPNQEEISRITFSSLRHMIKTDNRPYTETMLEVNQMTNNLEDNGSCRLADVFEKDHCTAIMTWEETRWAANQGVTIGSHTVDHSILDRLDEVAAREQLTISKKTIEQHTGKQCAFFCYPNGNWDKNIVSLVRETGFIAATTTDTGSNKVGGELLTLHRFTFPKVK
jgi:peptidoglycan/xylan/chitin deacetylase (PgdA/CDA1 family)